MRLLLAWGTTGAALIACGGIVIGPYPHGSNLTLVPPLARVIDRLLSPVTATVIAYVGITLLVTAWLALGLRIRTYPVDPSRLKQLFLAWAAPLAVGAPVFSHDAFSYAAQGRLAATGLNPYHYGPIALGAGAFTKAVSSVWLRTHVPYGPLFVGLERLSGRITGAHFVGAVWGPRMFAFLGVGLLAVFLPRLAVQCGARPAVALWLGLLNPIVVLHFVGGAHNDALMLGLLVAGVAMAGEDKPIVGLVLCTLAAAIKAPAAAGVVYVAIQWAAPGRLRDAAWATLACAVAIVVVTFGAVMQAAHLGWGWIGALTTPSQVRSYLSPLTGLGLIVGNIGRHVGSPHVTSSAIGLFRLAGFVAAAVISLILLLRRAALGPTRALGLTLLAVVALGPAVEPWYVMWGLVLIAAAGPRRLLAVSVLGSAAISFLVTPNGGLATDAIVIIFGVLTAGVLAASFISERTRSESPVLDVVATPA